MCELFFALPGAVITYDIVTGWNPIQLYDQYVSSVIVSIYSMFNLQHPGLLYVEISFGVYTGVHSSGYLNN